MPVALGKEVAGPLKVEGHVDGPAYLSLPRIGEPFQSPLDRRTLCGWVGEILAAGLPPPQTQQVKPPYTAYAADLQAGPPASPP